MFNAKHAVGVPLIALHASQELLGLLVMDSVIARMGITMMDLMLHVSVRDDGILNNI